jgi:hypothetical protein
VIHEAVHVTLGDVIDHGISRFGYEYDFGDSWLHTIEVEEVRPERGDGGWARCLDGARACPPEDCGGVGGHARLLEVLFDPRHPEFDETRRRAGNFEPDRFDLRAANAAMSVVSWYSDEATMVASELTLLDQLARPTFWVQPVGACIDRWLELESGWKARPAVKAQVGDGVLRRLVRAHGAAAVVRGRPSLLPAIVNFLAKPAIDDEFAAAEALLRDALASGLCAQSGTLDDPRFVDLWDAAQAIKDDVSRIKPLRVG